MRLNKVGSCKGVVRGIYNFSHTILAAKLQNDGQKLAAPKDPAPSHLVTSPLLPSQRRDSKQRVFAQVILARRWQTLMRFHWLNS